VRAGVEGCSLSTSSLSAEVEGLVTRAGEEACSSSSSSSSSSPLSSSSSSLSAEVEGEGGVGVFRKTIW